MSTPDPTADYRKYPKGPNFLGIVIGFAVFILLFLLVAVYFLKHDAKKVDPHAPTSTPNSLVMPLVPMAEPDRLPA